MLKNLKKYIEHITSNIFEFIALDDQPNVCFWFFLPVLTHTKVPNFVLMCASTSKQTTSCQQQMVL